MVQARYTSRRRTLAQLGAGLCLSVVVATGGALAATGAAGAAGNGVAQQSAQQIVSQALKVSSAANSFTMSGTVAESGQNYTLNIQAAPNGDGKGTIEMNSYVIQIVQVGSNIYLKANQAFWTKEAGASAASLFANKWIYGSKSSSDLGSLSQILNGKQFMKQVFGGSPNLQNTALNKAGYTTVGGKQALKISGSNGSSSGAIYVATSGPPYILKVTLSGGSQGHGNLSFRNYNQPVTVTAPQGAINIDNLGQGSSS